MPSTSWRPQNGGIVLDERRLEAFDVEAYDTLIGPSRMIAPRLTMDLQTMSEVRKYGVFDQIIEAFEACRQHDIPLQTEIVLLGFECTDLDAISEAAVRQLSSPRELLERHSHSAPVILDVSLCAIISDDDSDAGSRWVVHHVTDDLPSAEFLLPIHPLILRVSRLAPLRAWDVEQLWDYCGATLFRLTQAYLNELGMDGHPDDETMFLNEFRGKRTVAALAHAVATDAEHRD